MCFIALRWNVLLENVAESCFNAIFSPSIMCALPTKAIWKINKTNMVASAWL